MKSHIIGFLLVTLAQIPMPIKIGTTFQNKLLPTLHYPLRQRHRLGLPPLILTTARIFWRGRQVFQTTTGWVLSASNSGRGVVCDGEGEARLLIVN